MAVQQLLRFTSRADGCQKGLKGICTLELATAMRYCFDFFLGRTEWNPPRRVTGPLEMCPVFPKLGLGSFTVEAVRQPNLVVPAWPASRCIGQG